MTTAALSFSARSFAAHSFSAFSLVALSLAATPVRAANAKADFELVARGPIAGAAVSMSRAGYTLMFDLGGESAGIRSFARRRVLLSWDVLVAARAGELANSEPYLSLFGVRGLSSIEPAYRIRDAAWSPVISARLAGDAFVLIHPGLSDLRTVNDADGAAGASARGLVRVGSGGSFLDADRSFLAQAFVQEHLQTAGLYARAKALTEIGFALRLDHHVGVSIALEGSWGATAAVTSDALHRTVRTTRASLGGNLRKLFANGLWLGLAASIRQDKDRVVYTDSQTTFHTAGPAEFNLGLIAGLSLFRSP